jgi:hypothetical protein
VVYSRPISEPRPGAPYNLNSCQLQFSAFAKPARSPYSVTPVTSLQPEPFAPASMASSLLWSASQIGDHKGRVVIVTGSDAGIGYETAHELAKHGAHVIVATRDDRKGSECVSAFTQLSNCAACCARADIRAAAEMTLTNVVALVRVSCQANNVTVGICAALHTSCVMVLARLKCDVLSGRQRRSRRTLRTARPSS